MGGDAEQRQVAIFIDFENLIYGLNQEHGEQRAFELFSSRPLLDFASSFGQPCEIRAYADWRMKAVNRFQTQLYQVGAELVHVLGRFGKNSVDIRMAVDLTELVVSQERPETVMIVSGDRDFIHVLRCLKRYRRKIIGVAPRGAWSDDLRQLCDHFSLYEELLPKRERTRGISGARRAELAGWLEESLQASPGGMSGTQLRHQLEERSQRRFDLRRYGYLKLRHLLAEFPELVRIEEPEAGDLHLSLASAPAPSETGLHQSAMSPLLQPLSAYRYEKDLKLREEILKALYEALSVVSRFTWHTISEELSETLSMSRTALAKYHAILWQSRCFDPLPVEEGELDGPLKQRPMRLSDQITSYEDFRRLYERSILLKVQQTLRAREEELTTEQASALLGLDGEEEQGSSYVRGLIGEMDALSVVEDELSSDL